MFVVFSTCRQQNVLLRSQEYIYLCVRDLRGIYICIYVSIYSILHVECHLISSSNLNFLGLFSTDRDKRDLENYSRSSIEI